ncbi:hypothetical protein [Corynebacterium phoceense]|uniref:hypothetical protein n=1 Tax=Corynebacterium phoceense TaxID=1686286 RepID=UPI00211D0DE7|nr:hypothetical protein [Corynebacterium phoceense]MCQ9346734.1 hypothetical protein [Corynebacterium phoceense]
MFRRAWPVLWGTALVLAVTWPFLLPGSEFLWRDMAVPETFGLTPANFGAGDLAARAAPQDGVFAFFSTLLPAPFLLRALVISAAAAAAWGAWLLARSSPAPAMFLAVINPFTVERLLQGQWSLAIAAWLLVLLTAAGLRGRPYLAWAALFGASLTPTGALLGLATGVATVKGRRLATAGLGLAACIPWLVPGLIDSLHPAPLSDAPSSVAAFAPRAEAGTGTLGSLLQLGGLWNADALPASRQAGFAVFGFGVLACVLVGLRRVSWPLLALGAAGLGGTIACWLLPDVLASVIDAFPGAGILRDSGKLVALALPAYVAALGALDRRGIVAALVCLVLQMPDAATSVSVLAPRESSIDARLVGELSGRATFFADRPSLVEVTAQDGTRAPAVDPYSKAVAQVASGELVVDGQVVDAPSPRWVAARAAWEAHDTAELERLGIGAIVEDGRVVAATNAPAPRAPWVLTVAWLLLPLAVLLVAAFRRASAE